MESFEFVRTASANWTYAITHASTRLCSSSIPNKKQIKKMLLKKNK
jgi:hypothetical protein